MPEATGPAGSRTGRVVANSEAKELARRTARPPAELGVLTTGPAGSCTKGAGGPGRRALRGGDLTETNELLTKY